MFGFKFDNFGTYGRWRTLDLFEINAKVIIMYNVLNFCNKEIMYVGSNRNFLININLKNILFSQVYDSLGFG